MNEINKHTPYFGYESDKLKQSFNLSEGTEEAVYKFLETYNKSERGQFFAKNSYKKIIYHFEREYKDDLEILNNSFEQFLPIVFEEKCRKNSESLFYFPLSNLELTHYLKTNKSDRANFVLDLKRTNHQRLG